MVAYRVVYAIADELEARGDEIVDVARRETGLTEARLRGELARTTGQLRLLGDFVTEGRHLPHRASPGAAPGGGDIVTAVVPVGKVAVFAASNFPLAFGVAGGDTASALAAGCPVVVKAHPAQPSTSRLIASIVEGVVGSGDFELVEGADPRVSTDLVQRPDVRAVGFTGSLRAGRALMEAAASRPDPIPVYAEMGSLNPVFVLPGALSSGAHVDALAAAVTGSAGQLCTKPGLVVVPNTPAGEKFAEALALAVAEVPIEQPMLTPAMATTHAAWLDDAVAIPGASVYVRDDGEVLPFAVRLAAEALTDEFLVEHFGPAVVIVTGDANDVLPHLEGSLTATLLGDASDLAAARELLPRLAGLAGRVIWNGVPTGVAVCDAMQHGGPWPATSAPWSTSVGTAAIQRFLRPVALQGFPAELSATLTG
jgi:NADP-dependent aldehyde dehydrogenase